MLQWCEQLVSPGGLLFLVLPRPCIDNSRYLKFGLLERMLRSMGLPVLVHKMSPKLFFCVCKVRVWRGTCATLNSGAGALCSMLSSEQLTMAHLLHYPAHRRFSAAITCAALPAQGPSRGGWLLQQLLYRREQRARCQCYTHRQQLFLAGAEKETDESSQSGAQREEAQGIYVAPANLGQRSISNLNPYYLSSNGAIRGP